jgi:Methyltransferase domain
LTEWKIYGEAVPYVSTREFHLHRDRAHHLEQAHHRDRLATAAELIRESATAWDTFSDLGCGDGGLLSVVQKGFASAWGYDFQPSNAAGWAERGVKGFQLDAFGADRELIRLGTVVACTEVLEHLADPHGVLRWLYESPVTTTLVCSSPWNETGEFHDECHAWAWDTEGYEALVQGANWNITDHKQVGPFQVVKAVK